MNPIWVKRGIIGTIISILILTILEFPAPIGFETRPQDNVSIFWLIFFLIILVVEIAIIPIISKRPKLGAKLGITVAIMNILQVIADQAHLMQPEVAPMGYLLLEDGVVLISILLGFFCWKILKHAKNSH